MATQELLDAALETRDLLARAERLTPPAPGLGSLVVDALGLLLAAQLLLRFEPLVARRSLLLPQVGACLEQALLLGVAAALEGGLGDVEGIHQQPAQKSCA